MWRIKSVMRRMSSRRKRRDILQEPDAVDLNVSTASPITLSAADAVLKTPELLEMILQHVEMRELLFLQRVCHHWQDIITHDSLALRRKLFLAPAIKYSSDYPTDNPFLKARFPNFSTYLLTGNVKWRPKWVKALDESDLKVLRRQFYECETASWRRMVLTQPPVQEIVVYVAPTLGSERGAMELMSAQVTVKDERGVTMGMILEASEKARRRSSSLGVCRNDSGYGSILVEEEEVVDDI